MDHYNFHSARVFVDEHDDRRTREASAERLARQIRGTTPTRARTLIRAVRFVVSGESRRVRVRPGW